MESANWVCEEFLEEREWVSPLTIPLQEEEVSRELDNAIDVSLCGTMDISLVTVRSRLNVKLDFEKTRITKYHEVTNLATEAAVNVPYGGRVTPRTRLLESIPKILDRLSEGDWMGTGRFACASVSCSVCGRSPEQ